MMCSNEPLRVSFDSLAKSQNAEEVVRARTYECFLHAILGRNQREEWNKDERERFAALALQILQLNPPSPDKCYHHIFVDEARDFYGGNWPEVLKYTMLSHLLMTSTAATTSGSYTPATSMYS